MRVPARDAGALPEDACGIQDEKDGGGREGMRLPPFRHSADVAGHPHTEPADLISGVIRR
jgi:hypothetical protein